ncbi:S41 family peptidase [Filifactor villosus]|uniref:S41 family peptidase n=1 Tax=Filifactor villosus TaxID=29374 RepID=A0ABV9QJH5_9FIRM
MKFSKIKLLVYSTTLVLVTSLVTTNVVSQRYEALIKDSLKYEKLMYLEKEIEQNFYQDVNSEDLFLGMQRGLFLGLNDPYSEYFTKEELDELSEQTTGELIGIGVIVGIKDENIVVISPLKDSPADRVGIKPGDIISKVNDQAYNASQLSEAIKEIKVPLSQKKSSLLGKPDYGTVKIEVLREKEPIVLEIEREEIPLHTVEHKMIDELGYIQITQFAEGTARDFKVALKELRNQEIKGLIIDLRNNPGGLLDQVQEVADSIMGEATIVYTQDRKGKKEYIKSKDGGQLDIPLVVLINGGSASASEVLSGAVRDNEVGTLVGETTFGKALVQSVRLLSDGSGYKLTTQQYFTPKGENINHKGIKPDIEIALDEEKFLSKQVDNQLEKAKEILRGDK